ncbi:hypothetical protein VTK26DRAFT_7746 [Humicola hyalothermophila]
MKVFRLLAGLSSPGLRCNVGGDSRVSTTTIDVKAGDSFTFYAGIAVYHQGLISLGNALLQTSPIVKNSGTSKATDPGYTANISNNFRSYTVPRPAVFQC